MEKSLASRSSASGSLGLPRVKSRLPRDQSPARSSSPARRHQAPSISASLQRDCAVGLNLASRGTSNALGHTGNGPSPFCTTSTSNVTRSEPTRPVLSRGRAQPPTSRQSLGRRGLTRPVYPAAKLPGTTVDAPEAESAAAAHHKAANEVEREAEKPNEVKSSLDRIEIQAKESLSRLKHLLYKLKTRKDGDVRSTLLASPSDPKRQAVTVVGEEQKFFVSQKIEVDLSRPKEATESPGLGAAQEASVADVAAVGVRGRGIDLASLKKGLEIQLDAVTATKAIVTFDDATQTAVVTVTTTVRATELAMELRDRQGYSDRAIALAVKALARTCMELDEKTHALTLNAPADTRPLALPSLTQPQNEKSLLPQSSGKTHEKVLEKNLQKSQKKTLERTQEKTLEKSQERTLEKAHEKTLRALLSGKVVAWELAGADHGCTPFRPVYLVQLQLLDGSGVEAVFKPVQPGDRLLRWKRAPEDWLAYQLSCLLGMDVVPPAVMRSSVELGEKKFDLGVMVHKPASVLRLESTDPSGVVYGGDSRPQAIVSDIRILDALMGNALRQRSAFLATLGHWSERDPGDGAPRFYPVVTSHAMGPSLGKDLHRMWTTANCQPGNSPVVQVLGAWAFQEVPGVSRSTLALLRSLSQTLLLEAFGGVVSVEEIDVMLSKRDHLLAHFEGQARRTGWANVCL